MTQEIAIEANIVRETEKAVLIACFDVKRGAHNVWFPKSQIRRGTKFIFMPEWLAAAKVRDSKRALGVTHLEIANKIEAEASVH